jgi:hypothetical protein
VLRLAETLLQRLHIGVAGMALAVQRGPQLGVLLLDLAVLA